MKKIITVLNIATILTLVASAFAEVVLEESVVFGTPITLTQHNQLLFGKGQGLVMQSMALPFVPGRQDEGVQIFSLCTSSSSNLTQSRANAMAWMVTGSSSIPMDRTSNPAACYSIPSDGLQWFDFLTTGYKSWLGSTVFQSVNTTNENGHRIVVSCAGKSPVGNYWCRITSTSTNIGSAYFPVALSSGTTNEIPFNLNFVGIDYGENGTLDSFYDLTLGRWVQGGDDKVFVNGELPSTNSYTWWYRFGATVQKTVALPGDVNVVKAEFVSAPQSLTAELVVPSIGTNSIGAVTVLEAQPTLKIGKIPSGVNLQILGGQIGIPYGLLTTTSLISPISWVRLHQQAWYSGVSWDESSPDPQRYFRLIGVVQP